jgi:hypothetical protein
LTETKRLRKFGLVLGLLTAVFFTGIPLLFSQTLHLIPLYIMAGLSALALVAPKVLKPLEKFWLFIGHWLGLINTRIILGLFFIVIFTPISLIRRLFGIDPLHLRCKTGEETYRKPRDNQFDGRMMERMF